MSAAEDKVIARELILNACRAYATNESAYTNGEVKQAIRSLLLRVEDLIDGRERDRTEIERLREAAVNAVNGKDHAYREVWERLISHGLLSFIGGDGSGLSRALAFIDHLAARATAAPAAAKPASIAPAAESEVWREDKEDLRLIRDRLAGLIHNARYEPTQESLKTVDNLVAKVAARRSV